MERLNGWGEGSGAGSGIDFTFTDKMVGCDESSKNGSCFDLNDDHNNDPYGSMALILGPSKGANHCYGSGSGVGNGQGYGNGFGLGESQLGAHDSAAGFGIGNGDGHGCNGLDPKKSCGDGWGQ